MSQRELPESGSNVAASLNSRLPHAFRLSPSSFILQPCSNRMDACGVLPRHI